MMINFEEFADIAEEEVQLLPEYVFEELTGGVLVKEEACLHPKRVRDDLYILGTYTQGLTGTQIVLYYGSFAAYMPFASEEEIRRQIRDTVRHEFRHHLEYRAGLLFKDTLIQEDEEDLRRYFKLHGIDDPDLI